MCWGIFSHSFAYSSCLFCGGLRKTSGQHFENAGCLKGLYVWQIQSRVILLLPLTHASLWNLPTLVSARLMALSDYGLLRLYVCQTYVSGYIRTLLLSYRWVAWSYEVPFFAPACSLHHCYQRAGLGWVTRRELAWCSPSQRMVTAPPRISELVLSVALTTLSHAYFIFGVASWALIFLRTLRPHTLTLPSDIVS